MLKLRVITLVSLLIVAIAVGCSSSEETDQGVLAPALVIPDNYTKFTDESESFSIHYPNHWDSEFSKLEDLEEWIKQQISSRVSNVDTSAVHVIFSSVDYTQDDFFTNVNVIMERVPNDITAAEYFEAAIELSRTAMNSWQLHSEQPVTLGGLRTYMKESSFAFSEIDPGLDGRVRSFQTMLKNPGAGIAWIVTCSFESSDTSALETCKTVVKTSRLLN